MPDETQPPADSLYSTDFAVFKNARTGGTENAKPVAAETTPAAPAEADVEPKPVAEPEPAEKATEQEEADEPEPDPKPKKNGLNRRFSELTRERDEARAKAAESERKAAELERKLPSGAPKVESLSGKPRPEAPRLESFPTIPEYETARDRYTEELLDWREAERDARVQKQTADQRQADAIKVYQKAEKEFRAEHDDYDEVLASIDDLLFSREVMTAIATSDAGAALTYALAQDRALAERVSALSKAGDVMGAVRLIGIAEGRAQAQAQPAPKPQPVSKAPAPGKPVASRSAGPPPVDHLKAASSTGDLREYARHRASLLSR